MRFVTIGVGPEFERKAAAAADSLRRVHGVADVEVLTGGFGDIPAPLAKLTLLSRFPCETVCYFDADTVFLRPWDIRAFCGTRHPVFTLDWPSAARDEDCERYGMDPQRYVSSGFWIAGPAQRMVWAYALQMALGREYRTAFKYEQTALNRSVNHFPIVTLDRRYFWVPTKAHPAPNTVFTVAQGGNAPEDVVEVARAVEAAR